MGNKIQVATLILAALGCLFAYKSWDDAHMARLNAMITFDSIDNVVSHIQSLNDNIDEVKERVKATNLNLVDIELECRKDTDNSMRCKMR